MRDKRPGWGDPVLPTETIRITTTYEKAQVMLAAIEAQQASGPLFAEALAEVKDAVGQPERLRRLRETLLDKGYPGDVLPVRTDDPSRLDDYDERHPAYGMIGASRRQSNGTILAGSDFDHHNFVTITIHQATRARGLSHDRWHADKEIIEVTVSEAQWATFVSALNVGDGVPCTIGWTRDDGPLPGIKRVESRRQETHNEVKQDLGEATALLNELLADERLPKWAREKVNNARRKLDDSIPFALNSADEHIENTIEHAKIEIDAWATARVMGLGLDALAAGGAMPIALPSGEDE